ncbi:MAG: type IX secretion system membrane protein PorP/SprF [Bacteroidales bacterium]|nr:type IX secretion system membrane protein PorP/SprF [Bacteroidales bacterium]
MKKLIFVIGIVLIGINVKAQQLPLYSQYMMNSFLLNPGITGSTGYIPIRLTVRQQWTGIEDAPSTQALSANGLIGNQNMGVGGYIFNDKFGPISSTGVQASYAYHLRINKDVKLGLGLSLSAFQFKMDEGNLHPLDPSDQVLTGTTESTFVPDANFGAYLYSKKFFVGLSGAQLTQYKIKLHEELAGSNQMIRHYYLLGGYQFTISKEFDIQPSVLIKGTERTPFQLDVNVKAFYKKNYWLGFSYRTSEAAIALIGFKVDRFYLGYAFDYTFSNLSQYSTGSHEIMLGVNLGDKNKGNRLL